MSFKLEKYKSYSRKDIHGIFSPDTIFQPQRGTWGLHGIVGVPGYDKDYVFMVTFNQTAVDFHFEESITESGVLTWQSQPRQTFEERRIMDFISHDPNTNNIFLFLRTNKKFDYTYMGKLAYLSHDPLKERPVHFKWQILEWEPDQKVLNDMGLKLVDDNERPSLFGNLAVKPPNSLSKGKVFRGRFIDFEEKNKENTKLGNLGELFVLNEEISYLKAHNKNKYAQDVVHVSKIKGDGLGYDILSRRLDGEEKFIEVKTTSGNANTPFYISSSEFEFAKLNREKFQLYRVYDFDVITQKGYIIKFTFDTLNKLRKESTNYRIYPF